MDVSTLELKFLLKLLGQPGYRGPMKELSPNKKTLAKDRDDICRSLCSKGIVAYRDEITAFKITKDGKNLLSIDPDQLPLSKEALSILQLSKSGKRMTPGQLRKIEAGQRQSFIRELTNKAPSFLEISKNQLKEAWLTPQGDSFLRHEFQPSGGATISLNLLSSYVNFLRQPTAQAQASVETSQSSEKIAGKATSVSEILEAIARLDRQHDTDNYLPIFYLRDQVALGREELDRILYQLQRDDKIELGTLQESNQYSPAQISAGIPQDIGGSLFFISLIA